VNIDREPLTWGDLIAVFPVIAIEMIAAVTPDRRLADQQLEEVGSRLLDFASSMPDTRPKALILELARQLIATEGGSLV